MWCACKIGPRHWEENFLVCDWENSTLVAFASQEAGEKFSARKRKKLGLGSAEEVSIILSGSAARDAALGPKLGSVVSSSGEDARGSDSAEEDADSGVADSDKTGGNTGTSEGGAPPATLGPSTDDSRNQAGAKQEEVVGRTVCSLAGLKATYDSGSELSEECDGVTCGKISR